MKCFRLIRGDTLSPVCDFRKCNPLLAAGISAGASILGAKLNNDAIERNNQRQEGLINKQNSYNNPTEQVARMRQAGLNPYMMLGQINSGNQQSIAETQAGNYDTAVNGAVEGVNQALTAKLNNSTIDLNNANSQNAHAEAALKRVDLVSRSAKNEAEINTLVKQGKLSEQQAEQLRLQNDVTQLTWDEHLKAPGVQNRLGTSQSVLNEETARGEKQRNQVFKRFGALQADQDLSNARATYREIISRVGLNNSNSSFVDKQNSFYSPLVSSQIESNKAGVLDVKTQVALRKLQTAYYKDTHHHGKLDYWTDYAIKVLGFTSQQAGSLVPMVLGL